MTVVVVDYSVAFRSLYSTGMPGESDRELYNTLCAINAFYQADRCLETLERKWLNFLPLEMLRNMLPTQIHRIISFLCRDKQDLLADYKLCEDHTHRREGDQIDGPLPLRLDCSRCQAEIDCSDLKSELRS